MKDSQIFFDEDLFAATATVGIGFDESDWLVGHLRINREERESFLSNDVENPRFTYRAQDIRPNYFEDIKTARDLVRQSKAPEVVIDLYERKLDKMLLRNRLIEASLFGQDERFFSTSVEIYGRPKKRYFAYVAKRVLELCRTQKVKHPGSARRLMKVLGGVKVAEVTIDPEVLLAPVTEANPIRSVSEVVEIFTDALSRYGASDWCVEIDGTKERRFFSVNLRKKLVVIPSEEQLFSRPNTLTDVHVQALAEHEVGVHVRRVIEAERGSLKLLTVGLDGYLLGEEGVASYVQQQIEGSNEFYGFDRYLAACLAVGMDGEVRDFRGVFSLMVDYYTLKFADETLDGKKKNLPIQTAWDVCVRIFRGTTGQTAGCIYTKDIVYLEGNIGIWQLLIERPSIFEHLFVGKFNPLNARHIKTLQTLEIMP
jgi:hypothetical protein